MATTTSLTMVNRLLRRHGYEDYSTFALPETKLALDLVNQAIRDLLSVRDYPWNIRNDGTVVLKPSHSGTFAGGLPINTVDPDTFQITNFGVTHSTTEVFGNFVTRLIITNATDFPNTPILVSWGNILALNLFVNLYENYPGVTVTNGDWKFVIYEYLLPDSVAKVISVRHEEQPIRLVEVQPHQSWDEWIPRPHDNEGEPIIVGVGGMARSTVEASDLATANANRVTRLRLMVYPVPDATMLLQFSYKERLTELSATTDTLIAPSEFVDDVIDRAEALSNMTQRFNDPDLAQQQIRNSLLNSNRKWENSVVDPARRHPLRAQDFASTPRDPTRYRDIDGL